MYANTACPLSERQRLRGWPYSLLVTFVLLVPIVLQACRSIPPEYSYDRIPERFETVRQPPEVIEVDNCSSDLALERSVSRSARLGNTVIFDQEQVKNIAVQVGISNPVTFLGEIQSGVAQRFGAGLETGQSRTDSISVYVNPHRKAIATLEWVETWEYGHFRIHRDGALLGSVSYSLLKDIQLDSQVQSINCGWWGGIQAWVMQATQKTKASWPLRHLEITLPAIGIASLISVLVLRRLR